MMYLHRASGYMRVGNICGAAPSPTVVLQPCPCRASAPCACACLVRWRVRAWLGLRGLLQLSPPLRSSAA